MSHLGALIRAVCLALEVASHVAAASTDGDKVSHGKNSGGPPPYVASPAAFYMRRFDGCRSDAERRQVIAEALTELRSIRFAKKLKGYESRELRIRIGLAPDVVEKVAYQYQCSTRHVYRCRAEVKQLPDHVRRAATLCQNAAVDPSRK